MSQNISSFPIGTIYYQSGYGYPTHTATRGCTYIDVNTAIEYINKDGIVDWVPFLDSSSTVTGGTSGSTSTFTGGTVTGPTYFINGLTATTISATTIQTNSFVSNSTGLTQSSGFTILSNLSTLNAVNDAAASALGVPLYGLYRNGNVVQIRIT